MSVKVVTEVFGHSEAQLAARLVLLAIADNAEDGSGIAFPPIVDHPETPEHRRRSISFKTRLSEREVRRSLRELERMGELETRKAQRGRSRINVYRIKVGYLRERDPQIDDLPFQLIDPFATTGQDGRQSGSRPPAIYDADHRPSTPATTGQPIRARGEKPDHQDQPSWEPSLTEDSSEDEESSVPGLPGGTNEALIEDRNSLLLALSAEIATQGRLTRREHGAWNLAVSDLLEVGATIDDVQSRCRAYRELFPKMPLTPSALVNQWNLCGTHVAAPPTEDPAAGHERWLTKVCGLPDADLVDLLADRGFAVDEIPAQVERARELRLAHAAAAAVTERAIREGRQAA